MHALCPSNSVNSLSLRLYLYDSLCLALSMPLSLCMRFMCFSCVCVSVSNDPQHNRQWTRKENTKAFLICVHVVFLEFQSKHMHRHKQTQEGLFDMVHLYLCVCVWILFLCLLKDKAIRFVHSVAIYCYYFRPFFFACRFLWMIDEQRTLLRMGIYRLLLLLFLSILTDKSKWDR